MRIPTAAATVKRQRQPEMPTTNAGQSRPIRLFSITDKSSGLRFVVDTGAEINLPGVERRRAHVTAVNFGAILTRVIGRANEKMAILLLEFWSSNGTFNGAIDLNPAFQALRERLESVRPVPIRQTSTRNREPRLTEKRVGGRSSHDQSQTLPHECALKTYYKSREQQRLLSPLIDMRRPTDTLRCLNLRWLQRGQQSREPAGDHPRGGQGRDDEREGSILSSRAQRNMHVP
ncbi:unnamed protein product [Schistocephalus solidus]|uniref:Peptidase A2 domain-containing protein n=1 Tax=Schistocephalus solidus TaxID=70667 RepID=A0A183SLF6_SCHSO|nr:unnamed protein product [Schistocephalus solidus]